MNIREEIVKRRRERMRREGNELGAAVPAERKAPLSSFGAAPFLICEVKRRSPSKGWIARDLDPVEAASRYVREGVKNLSVLTEEDYFSGSLKDLMQIKKAFPELAVLRKDFLLDMRDVEVSWRAGADAVLLIASILDKERYEQLFLKARRLGMAVLTEVHDEADVAKVGALKPPLVGINSRDLSTFKTDPIIPLMIKDRIKWRANFVFESGVRSEEGAHFALSSGFSGILIGEAVVKDPSLIPRLLSVYSRGKRDFWERLYGRKRCERPLVKICGITRKSDASLAVDLGADILGFIFAPSKRRANPKLVEELKSLDVPRVAVVATQPSESSPAASGLPVLREDVRRLLDAGLIDAVQFHGDEKPEDCYRMAFPYYKALRLGDAGDADEIGSYHCPRILVDAYSPKAYGGTGKRVPGDLVAAASKNAPLWLAGGLSPSNIRNVINRFHPELVDASSGLESEPGVKDPDKMDSFFKEIENAEVL
jgi:indole-3-glycerol phosphate synthase/phosphoribosylanthranilate isomerase